MARRSLVLLVLLVVSSAARGQTAFDVLVRGQSPTPDTADDNSKLGQEAKSEKEGKKDAADEDDWRHKNLSLHAQATLVSQGNFPFRSPYAGRNSLRPFARIDTTATGTYFLAYRPWAGGDIVFNPEIAGGTGIGGSLGLGGFVNGEATRIGVLEPTPYIARLLYRQTVGLGGGTEDVEEGVNQVAGTRDRRRFTWQVGKFAAPDVIGDNPYSNDPRTQFLNWALMFNGAWDFPANVRGYTYGVSTELVLDDWTLTYGIFGEPDVANGSDIDPRLLRANGQVIEIERRLTVNDRPARVRFIPYLNQAHMGSYRESLALSPVNPDITATRAYRIKYGFLVNYEQELSDTLGLFARLGWNDGHTETWAYTEIDQTAVLGVLVKGTNWGRPNDRVGVAGVVNGLSNDHRDYLTAGGVGFILGDGRLRYGPEQIAEVFYNCRVHPGLFITLDLQGVANPGYNRDRGPLGVLGLRLHLEY